MPFLNSTWAWDLASQANVAPSSLLSVLIVAFILSPLLTGGNPAENAKLKSAG